MEPPATQPPRTDQGRPRWWLVAVLLCTLPFAVTLIHYPDNFFADDSYFYFQVAWNFAHGRGSTFNGLVPTNGYHPLWMLLCSLVYRLQQSKDAALHSIAAVITVLNVATLAVTKRLLWREKIACPWLAWLILVPFLFTSQLGTEVSLFTALLATTLLAAYAFAARSSPLHALLFGTAAALTLLSRLDSIFILTALTVGLVVSAETDRRSQALRMLLIAAIIPLLLWSAYLWSNHHWFGSWQPISGLLKQHNAHDHRLGNNLPRLAYVDLAVIFAALFYLYRRSGGLLLRAVEFPVAIGILAHAFYITLLLNSETRWTWYYAGWTLLAAILLAHAVSVLGRAGLRWSMPLLVATCVVLLLLAARNSALRGHFDPSNREPGFQSNVVDRAHVTTLFAFDKPGRIAYYTTARILPLDGLMSDLPAQEQFDREGIAVALVRYHADGFIGPPQPLDEAGKRRFCDAVFLDSTRFACYPAGPDHYRVDSVRVISPLTGATLGVLPLPASNLVWDAPGYVAVWRLNTP